jgi:hypothetical protein
MLYYKGVNGLNNHSYLIGKQHKKAKEGEHNFLKELHTLQE